MKRLYIPLFSMFLLTFWAITAFGQNEFYNDGADVYVQSGGLIYVQGEVINDDQGGNVGRIYNSGDIQLEGNWSNNSLVSNVFQNLDPGTTTFLGNNALQTIGGLNVTRFNNLTLNKPGGVREVRLLIPSVTDAAGVFSLTDDFMNTQVFIMGVENFASNAVQRTGPIVPPYTASTTQGYVTSTAGSAGRLARAVAFGTTYFYPVGDATLFRPVEVTHGSVTPSAFGVQFVNLPTPNTTLKSPTVNAINPNWFHYITSNTPVQTPQNLTIYSDFGPDNICVVNDLTMVNWDRSLWDDLNPTVTSTYAAGFLVATTKTGYPASYSGSPYVSDSFALAGNANTCPFPVEFANISARGDGDHIDVEWTVAFEQQNSGFELQRSEDGVDFTPVHWVASQGNHQNMVTYDYPDHEVRYNQRYYYRVKQVDLNGATSMSNIVNAILFSSDNDFFGDLYPNPTQNSASMDVYLTEESSLGIEIYDGIGKLVETLDKQLPEGTSKINLDMSNKAQGVYQVVIRLKGHSVVKKLIVR